MSRAVGKALFARRPPGRGRCWIAGHVGLGFALLGLAGCGGRVTLSECLAEHPSRAGFVLPGCVDTPRGAMAVEAEYLPGVLECEVGGFKKTPAAVEAQAIVARTYLLAHLTRKGPGVVVPLTARFQCWKSPRSDAMEDAARRTQDSVLHRHGDVLDANFAAGTPKLTAQCEAKPPPTAGYDAYETWEDMLAAWQAARRKGPKLRFSGGAWTEILVTRNEGRDGLAVEPTAFAPRRPTNRGAFGQWTAACLAGKRDYTPTDIVRYFFGADVQIWNPAPTGPEAPPDADYSSAGKSKTTRTRS